VFLKKIEKCSQEATMENIFTDGSTKIVFRDHRINQRSEVGIGRIIKESNQIIRGVGNIRLFVWHNVV
jgi:hypothetical protein